jgi:hypothetical protein
VKTLSLKRQKFVLKNGEHYTPASWTSYRRLYSLDSGVNIVPVTTEYSEDGIKVSKVQNSYTAIQLSKSLYFAGDGFVDVLKHIVTGHPYSLSFLDGFDDPLYLDKSIIYTGCFIRAIDFNFPRDNFVTCRLDIEAKEYQESNLTLNGFYDAKPFARPDITYTYDGPGIIISCSLRIEREFSGEFTLDSGSRYRQKFFNGLRRITGNLELYFEDYSHINQILTNQDRTLKIKLTHPPQVGHQTTIELFKIRPLSYGLTLPQAPQPLTLTLPFEAFRDSILGKDIEVIITHPGQANITIT